MERHSIAGRSVQRGFNRGKMARAANDGAFRVYQIIGEINQVVVHASGVELREVSQGRGSLARFLVPVSCGPIRLDAGINFYHRRGLREIVNLRWFGQAAQKGLLERHLSDGLFVSLIGGQPQVLAQRIVVVIYADFPGAAEKSLETIFADEIGTVEMVVADAHINAHETVARV